MSDIAPRRFALHVTLAVGALLASACTSASRMPAPTTPAVLRPSATSDPSPSPTRTATQAPSQTPTFDPYWELTVPSLVAREYGGGRLVLEHEGRIAYGFDRATFDYESDSLRIHAFADIPPSEGPHPVVIVLHGYIDPEEYNTLTYTTRYADALARAGFLAVHPNYRNYPPSDPGPNQFRIGYAIDVLNLIALIREQAGESGPFEKADPSAIGLFGHSMGGGIALRTITVDPNIGAALLYGSMSANERWNFEKIIEWSDGQRGVEELAVPEEALTRISAMGYLDRIEAAVGIHHGAADSLVPPVWSEDLCARLTGLDKTVECFRYPDANHTFTGAADELLISRAVEFFETYLRP